MAERADKTNKGDNEDPTKGHNLTEVHNLIRKASDEALVKEAQIRKAKKTHIEDLEKDLARIWQNAKADTGRNIGILKAGHKLRQIEVKGNDIEDDDERHKFQDDLKITFEAMHTGGQLDFLGLEVAPSKESKK